MRRQLLILAALACVVSCSVKIKAKQAAGPEIHETPKPKDFDFGATSAPQVPGDRAGRCDKEVARVQSANARGEYTQAVLDDLARCWNSDGAQSAYLAMRYDAGLEMGAGWTKYIEGSHYHSLSPFNALGGLVSKDGIDMPGGFYYLFNEQGKPLDLAFAASRGHISHHSPVPSGFARVIRHDSTK